MRTPATRLLLLLLTGVAVCGSALPASDPAQTVAQEQVVIVVVGAAGTEEYGVQFAAWAHLWRQACAKGQARFLCVGLDETPGQSDRERLRQTLSEQPAEGDAALWLVLMGHGTFDGRAAKFNLRGPDISSADLAEWLKPFRRAVAVINTASSSAPFLKDLSAPGRVVITATKSGFEHNYAHFGGHLAEAIVNPRADLDKDGQTSLLEAFLVTSRAVAEFYSAAGRLATEHALLDDNGDALGTPSDWFRGIRSTRKPGDQASLDGYRAHQFHVLYSAGETAIPPELRSRRDQLELQIMQLRDNRTQLSDAEYFSRLETLLREIALIYEQAGVPEAHSGSASPTE